MSKATSGQISAKAADVYEQFFVPALFDEAAANSLAAASVGPGRSVLDIACGTGALARRAAKLVGAENVLGVDLNPDMLEAARREAPDIGWREAAAEALPFEDGRFDYVFCQFGLMFFADREAALREMRRVAKPGGLVAVAVWDAIETSPGYCAMAELLDALFGPEAAAAMRAPFALGDIAELAALFERAGISGIKIAPLQVTARFDSLEAWVHTDIRGWTLADMIDDADYARLQQAAKRKLAQFVSPSGAVSFASPAHLVLAPGA